MSGNLFWIVCLKLLGDLSNDPTFLAMPKHSTCTFRVFNTQENIWGLVKGKAAKCEMWVRRNRAKTGKKASKYKKASN